MAQVLEQKLAAKDSHDSFHSSHSQLGPSHPPLPPPTSFPSTPDSSNLHAAALQAAGLPLFDIDAYLNDPRNQVVLSSPSAASSPPPKKKRLTSDGGGSSSSTAASTIPVQLGAPKTSHNTQALNQLCQSKGLVPEFKIDGDQDWGFGGSLTVGGQTIVGEKRWKNKKEAKEGLAEMGLPMVKEMDKVAREKENKAPGEPEKNWVGMLLGTYQTSSPTDCSNSYTPFMLCHKRKQLLPNTDPYPLNPQNGTTHPTSPPSRPTPNTLSVPPSPAPAPR